jgi:hypothetical protein
MNSAITMLPTKSITYSRRLIRGLGLFSILFSIFWGFTSWQEFQNLPTEPKHMTLSEAASLVSKQRTWAILDDVQWKCDYIFYQTGNRDTNIIFTNTSNTIWGHAIFSSKMTCDEIIKEEAVGVLDFANNRKHAYITENGFDVSLHETNGAFLSLCTYCGKEDSRGGVIISGFMAIMGIYLATLPLTEPQKRKKVTF